MSHFERVVASPLILAWRMNVSQYVRQRLNLVLLLTIPVLFVGLAFFVLPNQTLPVEFFEGSFGYRVIVSRRELAGAFISLEAATLVSGVSGLFLITSSREADRRLVLCGYRAATVVLSRLLLLLLVVVVIAALSVGVVLLNFQPKNPPAYFLSVLSGAAIYGSVGVLVGAIIRRVIEGSYIMFFMPILDTVILNSSMYSSALDKWWIRLSPAYFPARLLERSAFTYGSPLDFALPILLYLSVIWLLAAVTFGWGMRLHRPRGKPIHAAPEKDTGDVPEIVYSR